VIEAEFCSAEVKEVKEVKEVRVKSLVLEKGRERGQRRRRYV
jgi:hypothetical protein